MRVAFMGTPAAAVPSLSAVAAVHEVVGVYTRRDRPKGRGRRVAPSPVKEAAAESGLTILQPRSLRSPEEVDRLRELRPQVVTVVAFGMLLPPEILAVPDHGCVNVHFSLLPRWRGAAPVEHAVMAGDAQTGVTTMRMDEGLDTGPILLQESTAIGPDDTTGTLTDRLAGLGARLLLETLTGLEAGELAPTPQPSEGVTIAPRIEREAALLDPALTATELERRVRAMSPSPGAYLWFRERRLKVSSSEVVPGSGQAGRIVDAERLEIQTGADRLRLLEVQPEGKRRMDAEAFVRGYRPEAGEPVTGPGRDG